MRCQNADALEALKTLGRKFKAQEGARLVELLKTHIGTAAILVFLLYCCCYFILPSSNQRVSMLRWTHNSTIAEQKEYPRGKRIDYILHSAGRGRNCKVTQLSTCLKFNPCREIIPWRKFTQRNRFQVLECSLPLPPAIPASLAALVGTACSYSGNFFMIILG